jgi:hypothetical protein
VRVRACPGAWALACVYSCICNMERVILWRHSWPLAPSLTLSHKRHDFLKKVIEHKMCVLIFSTTFVQNISHCKKNLARYRQKCEKIFVQNTRYSCRILKKLAFSWHIFEKCLDIKFYQNPSSRSRLPCGRTDGHDKANSRLSQFCERALISPCTHMFILISAVLMSERNAYLWSNTQTCEVKRVY